MNYELIARVLNRNIRFAGQLEDYTERLAAEAMARTIADDMAETFRVADPNFNKEAFREAVLEGMDF